MFPTIQAKLNRNFIKRLGTDGAQRNLNGPRPDWLWLPPSQRHGA
jgi:hypothetical protein